MNTDIKYHFKKSRKQRSKTFRNMGVACWLYIVGLYVYEEYGSHEVSETFRLIYVGIFAAASIVSFYIMWWHLKNPATYEAIITKDRFIVNYPSSEQWSFDVSISDIKRFEYRKSLSHAGEGITDHGILLKGGTFHHISMNYGNHINEMYDAVKSLNTDVTFPKKTNKRVEHGPFRKDYED